MGLAGDDLPIATPPQPGIGYMRPGAQILAKDRLLLVSIVTKNCDVIVNPTLHLFDLDRTGISRWHRRDIRNRASACPWCVLFHQQKWNRRRNISSKEPDFQEPRRRTAPGFAGPIRPR